MIGKCIDDYEIQYELGKGSFATVYKARCRRPFFEDHKVVAIKKIDKRGLKTIDKGEERVRREIKIHSKLGHHERIVELLSDFEDKEYIYLILEYCSGGTLGNYVSEKALSEKEVHKIMTQLVEGLLYIHRKEVIHRDLSLKNILLTSNNDVKIADFGLSAQLANFTTLGPPYSMTPDATEYNQVRCATANRSTVGTPNFMAPEVTRGHSQDLNADSWSLGIVFYILLVGRPPFQNKNQNELFKDIRHKNISRPANISREAWHLLEDLLNKDPKNRVKLEDVFRYDFFKKYEYHSSYINSKSSLLRSGDSGNGSFNHSSSKPIERTGSNCYYGSAVDSGLHSTERSRQREPRLRKPGSTQSLSSERPKSLNHKLPILPSRPSKSHDSRRPAFEQDELRRQGRSHNRDQQFDDDKNRNIGRERSASEEAKRRNNERISHRKREPTSSRSDGYNQSNDVAAYEVRSYPTVYNKDYSGYSQSRPQSPERDHCGSSNRSQRNKQSQSSNSRDQHKSLAQVTEPLNARCLPYNRISIKDMIVTISEDEEVTVETLSNDRHYVSQVCVIDRDGKSISIYNPKNWMVSDAPPPKPPRYSEVKYYEFAELPKSYWTLYRTAKKIIDITRAVTPKITIIEKTGKFTMMQNTPDAVYEMEFKDGKMRIKESKIKFFDSSGRGFDYDAHEKLPDHLRTLWKQFLKLRERCKRIEDCLDESDFPITIGWAKQFNTPKDKENRSPLSSVVNTEKLTLSNNRNKPKMRTIDEMYNSLIGTKHGIQ